MSRFGCKCGNVLSNSTYPSINIVNIYCKKDIDKAVSTNPEITLWDWSFEASEDYEFWQCNECGRILQESYKTLSLWYIYKKVCHESYVPMPIDNSWFEVYLISDVDLYEINERDRELLLSNFVKIADFKYKYWFNSEQRVLQAYDKNGKFAFAYVLDMKFVN